MQRDLDAAPSETLDDLHELWNVGSEAAAEAQLLSFAACGYFGPETRTQAARTQSTLGRLELAHDGLLQAEKRMSAQLSLKRLVGEDGRP